MDSVIQHLRNPNEIFHTQGANQPAALASATTLGPFSQLPLELIDQIVALLPPSSAASLTLCSHAFMPVLGIQHLLRFRPCPPRTEGRGPVYLQERDIFLRGLVQDLPAASSIYCYHCHKIHFLLHRTRWTVCNETKCFEELWISKSERIFDRVSESLCQKGCSKFRDYPRDNEHTTKSIIEALCSNMCKWP